MKKYNVECMIDNAAQYNGQESHSEIYDNAIGDYIEAESEEEAIDLAINWIIDNVYTGTATRTDDGILIADTDDDGNKVVIEFYYSFTASNISDY